MVSLLAGYPGPRARLSRHARADHLVEKYIYIACRLSLRGVAYKRNMAFLGPLQVRAPPSLSSTPRQPALPRRSSNDAIWTPCTVNRVPPHEA